MKFIKLPLFIFGLTGLAMYGCSRILAPSPGYYFGNSDEISSVWSPDGNVLATTVKDDWRKPIWYGVKIENKHQLFGSAEYVVRFSNPSLSPCTEGIAVNWESDTVLVISYSHADDVYGHKDLIKLGGRRIEVKLRTLGPSSLMACDTTPKP